VVSTTFLLITEKPARPSFMNGKTGTVLNVFTEKDYRRRGISEILMKMLMQDAHEEGLDYIDLTATEDGYPLYKKLGFAEEKPKTKPMKLTLRKPEL
jgi:ribosomal protein S18 acetylase RimI-like enzyme